MAGGPHCDCKAKLAHNEEGNQTRRKAPPPRWMDPARVTAAPALARRKGVEENEKANELEELSEGMCEDSR